jgi:hypothetical protein
MPRAQADTIVSRIGTMSSRLSVCQSHDTATAILPTLPR